MAIKGGDPILEKQNWSTWFLGLCAFLFLCYGAAIYQEFVSRRTYIHYQRTFNEFESTLVEKEYAAFRESADGKKASAEVERLEAEKKAASEVLESDEYRKLEKAHFDQYIDLGYVKAERSKVKSNQDAKFYDWKHALHQGHADEAKEEEERYWQLDVELLGEKSSATQEPKERFAKARGFDSWEKWLEEERFYAEKGHLEELPSDKGGLSDEEKKRLEKNREKLSWETRFLVEEKKLAAIDQEMAAIQSKAKDAEKAWETAYAPFKAYEERLEKIGTRSIRNIDQIVNNRLGIGGAYTFGTVDRCRSCHVAIDRGTTFDQAKFEGFTGELEPYKKYKKVFSNHPKTELLMSKHPVDTIGCTVCHDGQGRATRIKTSLFGNPDDFVWKVDMDQAHGIAKDHGAHQWEWPLLRGDFMQSNCQRCHATQRWLDGAPIYEKGKDLFLTKGCAGCHAIKGFEEVDRVGPELTRIRSKVTGEWLVEWIQNPKAFYPDTRMPMFVFDEYQVGAKDPADNVEVMQHPERQSDTAIKMAAALWQASKPAENLPFGKFPGGGDAANGKRIIETVGCLGCHTVDPPAPGADPRDDNRKGNHRAPPLYKTGGKVQSADWIWNWVRNPRWHSDTTTMPSLRLSDSEARDVTAFLWAQGQGQRPKENAELMKKLEDPENAKAGNLLLAQWGCAGCHLIPGHEKDGRIGPELTLFGQKKPFELAFGDSDIPEHDRESWRMWTEGKIHNPRQFVDVRSAARMPWFGLKKDEIHALVVYLAGNRDLRVPADMKKQMVGRAARIERGRELVNRYNCVGCHVIEGRGGDVLAFNRERSLVPPSLNAEGLKINTDFLVDFLRDPGSRTIRPWLKIRMPTFPLSDEERADIIAYFRAVDGIDEPFDQPVASFDAKLVAEGEKRMRSDGCLGCHPYKGSRSEGVNPASNEGPDLGNVWRRFRPEGTRAWMKAPQQLAGPRPPVNMPNFYFDFDDRKKEYVPQFPVVDGKVTAETSQHAVNAISEFLMAQGGGRQVSMAP